MHIWRARILFIERAPKGGDLKAFVVLRELCAVLMFFDQLGGAGSYLVAHSEPAVVGRWSP